MPQKSNQKSTPSGQTAMMSQIIADNRSEFIAALIGFVLLFASLTVLPFFLSVVFWLIFITVLVMVYVAEFRIQVFSKPLFYYLKRSIPPMSETERIALQSGDTDVDAEIFRGQINWQHFNQRETVTLTDEEQAFLVNETEELCAMLDDWEMVSKHRRIPDDIWTFIKEKGFLGMDIPKKYGGKAFSKYAHSEIIIKIGTRSLSAAVTVMVPNSLGPGELIHKYGTKEQQEHYLPRLAKGEDIPCFGLTEPYAGSDATAIQNYGVICEGKVKNKKVLGIKLQLDKRYITLAPIATLLGVAFHLYDPDKLLGDETELGITLALVPSTTKGISVGERHYPLFGAFMNGTITGKDVFIPLENIIGGQVMIGQGWGMLMECLAVGRGISLPGVACSNGQVAYRMTGAYAKLREQFGLSIGKFEGVAYQLGTIGGLNYLINAGRTMTASIVSEGSKPALLSAITKYHMTELGRELVNCAMDVHGGKGIQLGPRNYLAMGHILSPVSITVEGANILTRNLMIFGQGAMRCHPYIQDEIALANSTSPDALNEYDKLLCQHVSYMVANACKTIVHALTGGYLIRIPVKTKLKKYYRHVTRLSVGFAFIADFSMILLGGRLKKLENSSARLGDCLSFLYLAMASIKYYEDQPSDDMKLYAEWAIQFCLSQVQQAIDELCHNYPIPVLGSILRFMLFPFGKKFHRPNDRLTNQLAEHMQHDSATRDRLSKGLYFGQGELDTLGHMEAAWQSLMAATPLLDKIGAAVKSKQLESNKSRLDLYQAALDAKIITDTEHEQLVKLEALRKIVIDVDNFDKL